MRIVKSEELRPGHTKPTSKNERQRKPTVLSPRVGQKAAREHTAQTSANCKLNMCVLRLLERSYLSISAAINSKYLSFKQRNRNKDIRDKRRRMYRNSHIRRCLISDCFYGLRYVSHSPFLERSANLWAHWLRCLHTFEYSFIIMVNDVTLTIPRWRMRQRIWSGRRGHLYISMRNSH